MEFNGRSYRRWNFWNFNLEHVKTKFSKKIIFLILVVNQTLITKRIKNISIRSEISQNPLSIPNYVASFQSVNFIGTKKWLQYGPQYEYIKYAIKIVKID